jgi:hypothetical protein
MKTFVGVILMLAGIVGVALAMLILAVALLLTIIDWQWDGPILWDRVLGPVLCFGIMGIWFIIIARAIIFKHNETLE